MKKTSLGELIANSISHGVGVILGIIGLVVLLLNSSSFVETLASAIFGGSLILLYSSSTLFHSFPHNMRRVYTVFQRFDHSAIFILIAGTYTPFLLLAVGNTQAYILLAILWLLTVLGIVMKSIWIRKYHKVHLAIYLLMGWSIVFVFDEAITGLENSFIFVLIGGLCYTFGVIFYVMKFKYQHFVWHLFVLAGSIFHYISILELIR
ncbi:MAG: PAQR family membrane homeostasis protein TrhA [Candidatus Izemoplasmataceae bacterium]